eukprot:gene13766-17447_t
MLHLELELVDDEQDETAGDQRAADQEGIEQHALDETMRQRADYRGRQECDEHAEDEAARRRIGAQAQ